ncbi:MAG: TetR/AcrR family transcriptional regulator [Mycobacteriales bacterium]
MVRVTREASKAKTRQHLLDEARRLFRDQGYAATSLEQIAEAAEVTKGAIYGHFSTKEDLLLSAIETTPSPDYSTLLNDQSRPIRERLEEFGRSIAFDEATTGRAELAVSLEFLAALLRNPEALRRFGEDFERRLSELAADDDERPLPGATTLQVWAIGQALFAGLQLYHFVAPDMLTAEVFGRAFELLAGFYPNVDPAVCTNTTGPSPGQPPALRKQAGLGPSRRRSARS